MYPTFPYCKAGTNPPPLYNTLFEHLQSQNQNQILNSNNPICCSILPRNQPNIEAVASVPIVGERISGKRDNQRKGNKNWRELLNDAQKKLRRKMKNRESATRSRERKKASTEQHKIETEELKKVLLMAQNSLTPKKQKQPQPYLV